MNIIRRLYLQHIGIERARWIPLSTDNCIVFLKYNRDPAVRRMSASALATYEADWQLVVDLLIKTLGEPEGPFSECQRTLAALGVVVGEPIIDKLIEALDDKDYLVRKRVVETLGSIGSKGWIDPEPKWKGYGNKKAVEPLTRKTLHDENEYVRRATESALRALKW